MYLCGEEYCDFSFMDFPTFLNVRKPHRDAGATQNSTSRIEDPSHGPLVHILCNQFLQLRVR